MNLKFGGSIVTSIQVVRGSGTDRISFNCSGSPSPFPEMERLEPGNYPPFFRIETRAGYAEEWLEAMFGVSSEDLDIIVTLFGAV
jgi:hypothetical protein